MLEKIQNRFAESIQIQIASAEMLPKSLSQAAEKMVACLLGGNKILVCGHGRSYANAQLLVSHLAYRYDLARPSFAAILLNFDGVLATSVVQDGLSDELHAIYKKQLQAVAKTGDLLVVFSPFGNEEAVLSTLHAAVDEELGVLAFTSSHNDHTSGLLREGDIEIAIPSSSEMRIIEGHQFSLNLLCELVDHLLFSQ
ncbi:SIS domain-containing protein [Pasteurellaceae bacterium RH1A]|nr:SIS domain-containing protein [Pasteurellaceae bacterium RH1A]